MIEDLEKFFADLEAKGEKQVRLDVVRGVYAEARKVHVIEEWLRQKDRERASKGDAEADIRHKEQMKGIRHAWIAAYVAAGAAVITVIVSLAAYLWPRH